MLTAPDTDALKLDVDVALELNGHSGDAGPKATWPWTTGWPFCTDAFWSGRLPEANAL